MVPESSGFRCIRFGRMVSFSLGVVLLLVSAFGFAGPQAEGLQLPVRFAVIGDRTGGHEAGIHEEILGEIERMKPDFVVGVGDMIEGYTSDAAEIEKEWREYQTMLETLSMPFYCAPGNHDIWDSTSGEFYAQHIGRPYYSLDAGPIHLVFLDTSRWSTVGTFPREQLDWLVSDLQQNRDARYTVVVYHIPYWIETVAKGRSDPLHDIFMTYGVDAVFTGHYHVYFSGKYDGIAYTGVGSSGADCEPGLTGLKYHFVWVTADEEGISIAPIRMGSVLPWDEVTAAAYNMVERIKREAVTVQKVPVGTAVSVEGAEVAVTVRNFSADSTMIGTLEWKGDAAWTVRPKRLPIQIAPGGSHTAMFEVETDGPLYPVPTLSMAYPYDFGARIDVEAPLRLARTAYAHRADRSPEIDGRLEEPIWMDPVTALFTGEGFSEPADSTRFYFAWDDSNLYVGAVCIEQKMGSLVADVSKHDGAVYGEDCVGFFLQPNVPNGSLYQIYFNPLGTSFDQKIGVENGRYSDIDRDWNGSYDVSVSRGSDRWILEARIPLGQLGTEGQYEKTWAVNFRRKQKRLETSADWQVPIDYNPVDYGYLVMQ
jgi:hypothetical protein